MRLTEMVVIREAQIEPEPSDQRCLSPFGPFGASVCACVFFWWQACPRSLDNRSGPSAHAATLVSVEVALGEPTVATALTTKVSQSILRSVASHLRLGMAGVSEQPNRHAC